MIGRILAGAAIAAAALGFTATTASADQNPQNSGQAILSQFQVFDDVLNNVLNNSLNDSIKNIEVDFVESVAVDEVDLDVFANNHGL
ncbi:hypothetical protein EDD27_8465 [Nonomuraea polychroma]|uniref:Uncharacterized protein n=1 Tax=Nonomuraea polychroma TaxID=46176 RepID=A0A438MID8_9ACTN|nr:hypothetical protein [Nonomuraea polychroma]RVX45652.1 hypothetical protein EDD27_8465 [Nonomuraea polychroma]